MKRLERELNSRPDNSQLESLKKDVAVAHAEMKPLQMTKDSLLAQISDLTSDNVKMAENLARALRERADFEASLLNKESETASISDSLARSENQCTLYVKEIENMVSRYTSSIEVLESELAEARGRISELTGPDSEHARLKRSTSSSDQTIQDLVNQLLASERTNSALSETNDGLSKKCSSLAQTLQGALDRQKELDKVVREVDDKNLVLSDEKESEVKRRKQAEESRDQVVARAEAQIQQLETRLNDLQQEMTKQTEGTAVQEQSQKEQVARNAELERLAEELEAEKKELENDKTSLMERESALQAKLSDLEALALSNDRVADLEKKEHELQEKEADFAVRSETLSRDQDTMQGVVRAIKEAQDRLQTEAKGLEQRVIAVSAAEARTEEALKKTEAQYMADKQALFQVLVWVDTVVINISITCLHILFITFCNHFRLPSSLTRKGSVWTLRRRPLWMKSSPHVTSLTASEPSWLMRRSET